MAALLLFEAVTLHVAARDAVAPFYPISLDQVQYLTESYTGYGLLGRDGPLVGALEVIREPRAQGMLLQFEAAALFIWTGPQRVTALDLNIAFLLLYLGLTVELVRRFGGLASGLVTAGLITAAATTTLRTGGIFDFRLDFAAMCLWGSLVGLVALGPLLFRRQRFLALAISLIGSCLVLTRIVAAAYVGILLSGAIVLTYVVTPTRCSGGPGLPLRRGLVCALCLSMLASIVFIVQNQALVSGYYLLGHVLNDEKHLRAAEVGVTDLPSSFVYYLVSLLRDHAGRAFAGCALLVLASAVVAAFLAGRQRLAGSAPDSGGTTRWVLPVLVLAFLGPYAVLSADEAKSSIVGDVLVPPSVLALSWLFSAAVKRLAARSRHLAAMLVGVGGLVLAVGLVGQWNALRVGVYESQWQHDLASASQLMEDVGDYLVARSRGQAVWAMDAHLDFTPSLVTRVYYYEQHQIWLDVPSVLGDGPIYTTLSEDEIVRRAASSSILILTAGSGPVVYPYDASIEQAKPALFALAQRQFNLLGHYRVYDRDVFAYVRSAPPS